MILIGSKVSHFRTKRHKELKCYNCNHIGHMDVKQYVRTFNLYLIPVFPIGLYSEVACTRCGNSIEFNEMGYELDAIYDKYRPKRLPPIQYFTGLFLIVGLVLFGMNTKNEEKEELKSRIENLEMDYIFEFQTGSAMYSTFQVVGIKEELINVVYNLYEIDNLKNIETIHLPENYSTDTISLDLKLVDQWVDEGKIQNVYRGRSVYN